jgi:mercuric ion transport protein
MTRVELIYDADCPNVTAARQQLLRAFAALGITPRWQEWERGTPGSPAQARGLASPTILVDGRDVTQGTAIAGSGACRVYTDESGRLSGVPALENITTALFATEMAAPATPAPATTMKRSLPALPAIGLALLPKLTCAACWPAYAGLLSALGIGFFDYTPYLLPLTALFLVLTLAALGYRARDRRGFAPFALGSFGVAVVLIGKFWLDSDAALYAGVSLLIGASLWNAWPKVARGSCPACVPDDSRSINEHRPDGVQIR